MPQTKFEDDIEHTKNAVDSNASIIRLYCSVTLATRKAECQDHF